MTSASKTPWVLIFFLALVAAAISSAGMYYYMQLQDGAAPAQERRPQAPLLVTIAPLTVNLRNERGAQELLYVGFAVEVGNEASETFLKQYMPQVRSRILTLLSGQDSAQLLGAEGKAALAAKVLAMLRQAPGSGQPPLALLNVLYTDFIVQ